MRESGRSGRSCPASGRLQLAVIGYDFYVDGVKHNTAPAPATYTFDGLASMVEIRTVAGPSRHVQ